MGIFRKKIEKIGQKWPKIGKNGIFMKKSKFLERVYIFPYYTKLPICLNIHVLYNKVNRSATIRFTWLNSYKFLMKEKSNF